MKRRTARLAAAGIAGGLFVAGAGLASAGHLNPLLEADLDGRQEVGGADVKGNRIVGDPNARGEGYVFGIDDDWFDANGNMMRDEGEVTSNTDTLCYILIVDGIAELESAPGNGRMAHIHRGAKGENGPVVANLAWPQDGQAADCLTEGEAGKGMAPGIVQEILANPEGFYFNVHNNEYPGGAVRGQLSEQGHGDHDH